MHSIEQISSFVAVYEAGSYSAAAKLRGKSRATIREQIQAYEDIIGYDLFTIDGKKATPTTNAEHLIKRARLVVRQHESLYTHSMKLFDERTPVINICHDTITPTKLIICTDRFVRKHHPYVNVNWFHRSRSDAIDGLESGEYDLAILPAFYKARHTKNITWKALGAVPMKIFARPTSPLRSIDSITIEDLSLETHLVSEGLADIDSQSTGFKMMPNSSTVSNNDILCELLLHNGWSFLPEFYVKQSHFKDQLIKLEVDEINKEMTLYINCFYTHDKEQHELFSNIINNLQRSFLNMDG